MESENETKVILQDGQECQLHGNISFVAVAAILTEILMFQNLTHFLTW